MITSFENIHQSVTSLVDFALYWRFKGETIPDRDLKLIAPLNAQGATFLKDFLIKAQLHANEPFKKDFFETEEHIIMMDDNAARIKQWLYGKGVQPDEQVYLLWNSKVAAVVPFSVLVEYFEDFYYPSSDDLTVFDGQLNWALLFHHAEVLFWGSGRPIPI
ncbi:hypothetical protein LT679_07840 [Mucilaginibacter roseus]|uniref:Uncharacterized protein n=1 Tax=Mucilaginibacter roseus TaxID=1528868 RepID=A0ABS8U362_9SPHI|nr:hypothetical protein [Mucilaginibacter roseus]MCD8740510.1 hypothetical protein [Mucilaginibacter roseus]